MGNSITFRFLSGYILFPMQIWQFQTNGIWCFCDLREWMQVVLVCPKHKLAIKKNKSSFFSAAHNCTDKIGGVSLLCIGNSLECCMFNLMTNHTCCTFCRIYTQCTEARLALVFPSEPSLLFFPFVRWVAGRSFSFTKAFLPGAVGCKVWGKNTTRRMRVEIVFPTA